MCRLVRRLLSESEVPFAYIELDTLPSGERRRLAKQIITATNADALPVTRVEDTYIVGFDRDAITAAIGGLRES
jgi:glutaredoxin